jgi:hypothetical protein
MNEICSGEPTDSANRTLSNTILMMRTHPTEIQRLALTVAVFLELGARKNTIVRVISLDSKAKIMSFGFKNLFATDGSRCREVLLWEVKYLAAGVINIESAPNMPMMSSVLTKS